MRLQPLIVKTIRNIVAKGNRLIKISFPQYPAAGRLHQRPLRRSRRRTGGKADGRPGGSLQRRVIRCLRNRVCMFFPCDGKGLLLSVEISIIPFMVWIRRITSQLTGWRLYAETCAVELIINCRYIDSQPFSGIRYASENAD